MRRAERVVNVEDLQLVIALGNRAAGEDEYQSKENAQHVIRSMKENARQGFWNGATAPLGYKLVEAEKRGEKIKKKLDIDPVEVETVRLIYKLYLHGDGSSGALGVKEVVKWLNRNGHRTRRGECFGAATAHNIP